MKSDFKFPASFSCVIGDRVIAGGDPLFATRDTEGLYWLYVEDDQEPVARLTTRDINKLAGKAVVQE